ncbi:hypothetical protein NPA11_00460 [Mycoplasma sp. 1578d]|uniref:P68 family surface lipoprotein n=1 Tax=Mycoplasma sp. 1578d TaxID=2967299 RepID=UPI00211BF852|nr:hypothetical protein [Mycoplasma sp. 1578d]UUM19900.1 hypothetical protein NPA11_00460 [Mycoplasma sp. 1578d]
MNKIKRIKFLTSVLAVSSATSILAASCQANQSNYPTDKAALDKKIVLAASQTQKWPLIIALNELIPLYNEQMKNDPDFLKVELQTREITGAQNELDLTNKYENYIKSNSEKVANLLLGNQTTAYVINKYGKLLDTTSVLSPHDFPTKLLKAHTQLVGEDLTKTKIYNLPFNVSDTNGFLVNIDLLNKALDLAQQAGATVDKTGELFKTLEAQKDKGSKIPDNSAINFLKVKPNSLKGYTINEKTFKGLNGLFEFARKLKSALEIDHAKVEAYGKKINRLNIFAIDYQEDEFFKSINNQLKGKQLWELEKNNGQYDFSKVKYNIKDDPKVQEVFKKTFDQFVQNNSSDVVQEGMTGGDPVLFKDIKFNDNVNEWAPGTIRNYNTIFAIAVLVGFERAVNSPTSRDFYSTEDPKTWATRDDVLLKEQITKNNADDTFSTYFEGGSTLIPVSVDNNGKEDKATLLFLKWLYKQKVDLNGEKIAPTDLITRKSAYFIPTKEIVDRGVGFYNDVIKKFQEKIAENKAKIEKNDPQKEQLQKENDTLETYTNNTYSGAASFKSFFDFYKDNNEDILNLPKSEKTTKIIKKIESLLLESNLDKNPNKKINGEMALQEVLKIINDKS